MPIVIEYNMHCPECKTTKHRREFRKHGGGVTQTCRECTRAINRAASYARRRTKEGMMEYAKACELRYKEARLKQTLELLHREYVNTTNDNCKRIKALQARERRLPKTERQLQMRITEQKRWRQAYEYLVEQAKLGNPVMSLGEYMGRI